MRPAHPSATAACLFAPHLAQTRQELVTKPARPSSHRNAAPAPPARGTRYLMLLHLLCKPVKENFPLLSSKSDGPKSRQRTVRSRSAGSKVREKVRAVHPMSRQGTRLEFVVLRDELLGTCGEAGTILVGPPVDEVPVAVVLGTLVIEAVADHICETLFVQDGRVEAVTVKIVKLAISEAGEKIGITLTRERR